MRASSRMCPRREGCLPVSYTHLAVPVIKEKSHLPVLIDPSHAAGIAWMVKPLARTAVAAGADGLMIEVHNNPSCALCDGAQSLDPAQFDLLMQDIRRRAAFEEKVMS